jgi:Ser/Thr protein kinase RdoA (MazF antagonist)
VARSSAEESLNVQPTPPPGTAPDAEAPFGDGNVTGAARVGATVRRRTGPWSPTIHALLRHLERVGFAAAPRLLGVDGQGREVLTYVAGETSPDPRVSFGSDEALARLARLLRQYHDATTTFVPPPDAAWWFQVGAPASGDVICHNDIAPWNTVVAGGRVAAFVDWDFAAPAPRLWDIAHASWRFVPLYDDPAFGTPTEQARRLRLFCDAYGLAERDDLLATIVRRQRVLYDSIAAWAAGQPAFVALWQRGDAAGTLKDSAYLTRHRRTFSRELGRRSVG